MSPPLTTASTVCALVPHHACEQWLDQALTSLLEQSRPPEAIVVIDDASPEPPVDIVSSYPEVTLLRAADNGGPYRLIQAVIARSGFDAYLFQDADDWSAPDRLERLLAEAERTGAELVGSHEVRILAEEGDVLPVHYPLDVNAVLRKRPTAFPLLHPTSMVGRDLVRRLGGFASGMRFSGDAEFLRRAAHLARVVNTDHHGYFRRKRPGSLTTSPATALRSPNRLAVQQILAERAEANASAVAQGRAPDLRPWKVAPPPRLAHLAGPPLQNSPRRPGPVGRRDAGVSARPSPPPASQRPAFVVGAPRSGLTLLAWALGQHPGLATVVDPRWLARITADVEHRVADDAAPAPAAVRPAVSGALGEVVSPCGRLRPVAGGVELTAATHALAALFPHARFVHVVRDAADGVASLVGSPTEEGVFYTLEGAWRAWITGVEAGLAAEEALGADAVLRVAYADLVRAPEQTLRRCLAFLDEPYHPPCVRPVRGLAEPRGQRAVQPVAAPLAARVRRLEERLARGVPAGGLPQTRKALAEDFARRRATGAAAGATLVDRFRTLVTQSTPEGARVAVISRGDPRLVDLDDREGWHLPQVDGGIYAGFHPADSGAAVAALDDLRSRGAEYLAMPASAAWWLGFYDGLRDHLVETAELVSYSEEIGALFRLGRGEQAVRFLPTAKLRQGADS